MNMSVLTLKHLYSCVCVCARICVGDWKAPKAKKKKKLREWKRRILFTPRRPSSFKDVLFHGSLVEFMLMRAALQKAHQYRARTHSQTPRYFGQEISPLLWRPTWKFSSISFTSDRKKPQMIINADGEMHQAVKSHSCNFQLSLT